MFSIGISEVLLVVVVGCLVTDPKKLPGILKNAIGYYRKFDEMRTEVLDSFREIWKGSVVKSENESTEVSTKQIVGDDGVVYEAYEVSEIVETRSHKGRKTLSTPEKSAKNSRISNSKEKE
ncbi:hypothetical protein [Candidatus Anaplasma sp. TIGMIC]|uniref:Sec-independent protein translocase subunit TatB n=1 Tax=Candidatus Anaplasma sp. TIGMIC TaxID=3020713 RepID=UPI00232FCAF0|nr:hypothetical protein [Candidatus Anaplasma sp. TIGMIC]MDB1135385.1 hypothetical protein [Candidatus Anaplasma sp. TIGMIC]